MPSRKDLDVDSRDTVQMELGAVAKRLGGGACPRPAHRAHSGSPPSTGVTGPWVEKKNDPCVAPNCMVPLLSMANELAVSMTQ
jgi:hypothetical protein